MSELSFDDLLVLNRADLKREVLDMKSLSDESSLVRFVEVGLADDEGKLSKKGLKMVEALRTLMEGFVKGVPMDKRIRNEHKEAEHPNSSSMGWIFGECRKKAYITNSEMLLIGRPTKSMRATEGKSSTRQSISNMLTSNCAGRPSEFTELLPFAFQLDKETNTQFIWMKSKDGEVIQAIQSMYYDLALQRYPTATFHVNVKKETKYPSIQVRVTNRGWKNNVVGFIMVLDQTDMVIPNFDKED